MTFIVIVQGGSIGYNKPYPKWCHQAKHGIISGGTLIFLSIATNGGWYWTAVIRDSDKSNNAHQKPIL